tara:strand:- start:942 stop:1316 length:375 start_codon:yes stop_codon:yes gene_type:complete
MRKILILFTSAFFLSGCYSNSLTLVGPATGVASGKITETATSTSINYVVKKGTGKTPIEHVLSDSQIKKVNENKAKINPCNKNENLCSVLAKRIKNTRKELLKLNLQSRIEKTHQEFLAKSSAN